MKSDRSQVLAAYADGSRAVEAIAARITDWSAPTPCEQWQAVDLAGHLLAIIRYYAGLLNAAEAGRPRTGLPTGRALAAMNARDLLHLPPSRGPQRIAAFLPLAGHYHDRLAKADWHAPLGEWDGVGTLTVGEHAGLASAEWHIHAWDLAQAVGQDHRHADPETIAVAREFVSPSSGKGDTWLATLVASGRRPSPPETMPRAKDP